MTKTGQNVSVEQVPVKVLARGERAMDAHNEPFTVGDVRITDFGVEVYDKNIPGAIALELDYPDDLVLRLVQSERARGTQGQPRSTPEPYAQIGPVRIDPDLRKRLDEHCTAQSVTLRAFVERAVARELERNQ